MEFEAPRQDSESGRSLFLHAKGYYEHVRYFQNDPEKEQLLTFRKSGRLSEFSFELFREKADQYNAGLSSRNKR